MVSPWTHDVSEVRVSSPLVYEKEPDRPLLWGVELTSGKRCEAGRGMGETYRGSAIRFRCGEDVDLLGKPIRNAGLWRIREVKYSRKSKSYSLRGEAYVAVAWYGAANEGLA